MTKPITNRLVAFAAIALLGASLASAQDVYQKGDGTSIFNGAPGVPLISGFNSIQEDTTLWGQYGFWDPDTDCTTQAPPCWDFNEGGRDYALLADYSSLANDNPEGASAVVIEWSVFSDQSWGGSSAFQHRLPDSLMALGTYYDFSDFTHLSIDYNNLTPSGEGALFRFKINDASDGGVDAGFEDWYAEDNAMLEAQPGWNTFSVPLETVPGCCGSGGFNRPGWSGITGNDQLDLDKVGGFQLEFVAPAGASSGDSTVAGTVVWDNFRVEGVRYNTVSSFEAAPTTEQLQSNAGSYTVSTNTDDKILDAASMQVDYSVVGDQGWGGELDLFWEPDGAATFGEMASRTHLSVFYKVLTPASAGGTFGVRVFDGAELFVYESTDVMVDDSGNWNRFLVPFNEMTIPSWCGCADDGVLNRDNIVRVQFVFYTGEGSTTTGSMLFDRLTGYGFQQTDNTAPNAPTGVAATVGADYENIITWGDVAGEDGESYTIYWSDSEITDVTADGVNFLASVDEGVEVYVDALYYPAADAQLTRYYAVAATDAAGNVGSGASAGSVTNTAFGVPSIANTAVSFTADGDLSEFAGITPIRIEAGTRIGHVAGPTQAPADASDFSADAYVSIDSDNLYIAIDVTDDIYDPVPEPGTASQWMYDGAEFYIGLYDGRAGKHTAYLSGATPDYKFNLYSHAISDAFSADNNTEFYYHGARSGGWVVEAKIPLDSLQVDGQDKFSPREGMWLPLDIVLFDDDTAPGGENRETILTYSPFNDDNSWQSPANWHYNWIGNRYSVGVENVSSEVPGQYELHANYPNPFNPVTTFRYDLAQSGKVTLEVYNLLGQRVAQLVNGAQAPGTYEVHFDASNLTSGVYLYTLKAEGFVQSRKMTLIR